MTHSVCVILKPFIRTVSNYFLQASFSEKCAKGDRSYRLKHCTEGALFDQAIADYLLTLNYTQRIRNICRRLE